MERQKVRIKKLPASYGVQTPPSNIVAYPGSGFPNYGNDMEVQINSSLRPTSKANATLEAEQGETVITNLQGEGIPEFYTVGGKRHYEGGTPLNLPPNSFFFSRDRKMKIKDPAILKMFGKSGTKALTPADISKQYDINKYREILANPFSDKLQVETAELMIRNYNNKLGALAMVQESIKGFDNGIPAVAIPYLENVGIVPEELVGGAPSTEGSIPQFKKGGQYLDNNTGTSRVRIVKLPRYQKGREVQDIPENARKWDPDKPGYDVSKLRVGDYVWDKETKKYRLYEGRGKKKATQLVDDPNLGDYANDYSLLIEKFSNTDFRDDFYEQYKTELQNTKPNGKLTQKDIDEALAMKKEDVINTFLYKIKSNIAVYNKLGTLHPGDAEKLTQLDPEDKWDHDNKLANEAAVKLGYKPYDVTQIAAFQAGYAGINAMSKSGKYQNYLSDMGLVQVGRFDEQIAGEEDGSISQIDGWDGNTTSGQVLLARDSELKFKDIPVKDLEEDPETKPMEPAKQAAPGKFWTQDLVNMSGALGDYFGVKKIQPWQAPLVNYEATPTFTDFRGAAARIGSQGAGLANAATTFSGPQSTAATLMGLQSGMAQNIGQVQEAEQQANIGVANQFELANVQQRNQFAANKAQWDTALYDKYTVMQQQFKNAKTAAKWNMLSMFNNALTNRGKTQSMNSLYDNYYTDPATGYIDFTRSPGKMKPDNSNQNSYYETIAKIKDAHPDWDSKLIALAVSGAPKVYNDEYPAGVQPSQVGTYPQGYPGATYPNYATQDNSEENPQ
jgi:hypothetical protein